MVFQLRDEFIALENDAINAKVSQRSFENRQN